MIIPGLILGITGYALYKYCSSDGDDDQPTSSRSSTLDDVSFEYSGPYYSTTTGVYHTRIDPNARRTSSTPYRMLASDFGVYDPPPQLRVTDGTYCSSGFSRSSGNSGTSSGRLGNPQQQQQQQNSTESAEQLQFRRIVLRHFKCPFKEENACQFQDNPHRCLFTHVGLNGTGAAVLKDVPAYVCIYHLINSCPNMRNATTNRAHNPNSCNDGIHLSMELMVDLEYYERANRQTIRRFFGGDAERECGVCLETVLTKRPSRTRLFAILENCVHCYCAQCIIEWRTRSLTCPVCRTVSERVVYRPRFADKPEKKRSLFL